MEIMTLKEFIEKTEKEFIESGAVSAKFAHQCNCAIGSGNIREKYLSGTTNVMQRGYFASRHDNVMPLVDNATKVAFIVARNGRGSEELIYRLFKWV